MPTTCGPFQIENAPAWASSEGYDIVATHGTQDLNNRERDLRARLRTRALLADRFNLSLRESKKTLPVLALRQERSGHKMMAKPNGRGVTINNNYNGNLIMRCDGVDMKSLAAALGSRTGRPVVDETGIPGIFEFELKWTNNTDGDGPSLYVALKEQLGLRLESSRGEVPVLVIERLEKPTEN
jgi:bla regulator protein BlaR1